MKTTRLLIMLAILALAACTSAGNQAAVQVPTLAVLPSETQVLEHPLTPSDTRPPTITPTPTLSPVPSDTLTPSTTPLPPCDMASWWKQVEPTVIQFLDTVDVAGATPRASLSPVLLDMRQTYRTFQRTDHPSCADDAYNELVEGMDATAQGYNDFLAQLDLSSASDLQVAGAHFWAAQQILAGYNIELDRRALLVTNGLIVLNAATATRIAQLGVEGLNDVALTEEDNQLSTQSAGLDPTLTAIFQSYNP